MNGAAGAVIGVAGSFAKGYGAATIERGTGASEMALGDIGRQRARIEASLAGNGRPEELARLEVALEETQHHLNLAQTISERRARECERLEREFALLRAERDGYRHQLEERNRMLAAILGSRSWRWTRALRRTFGRG